MPAASGIDALGAHLDRLGATVLETGESAAAANERTATLKAELGEVRHVAETAARGLEVLRAELVRVPRGRRDPAHRGPRRRARRTSGSRPCSPS